jgi:23S rRNA (cytosine1962-C5)-methyltransferase
MYTVKLKRGKEKAVRQMHPWIFSGAVEKINGKPENGDIIMVCDSAENFLAYGFFNDRSRVAVRLLEWNRETEINEDFWRKKIAKAIKSRDHLSTSDTNTYRLIFSEADRRPLCRLPVCADTYEWY